MEIFKQKPGVEEVFKELQDFALINSERIKKGWNLLFALITGYFNYVLLSRYPFFPSEWVGALTIIVFLFSLKSKRRGITLFTLLVTASVSYQSPELGLFYFIFFFVGFSVLAGDIADHVLFPIAILVVQNPLLQSTLLPTMGLVYGGPITTTLVGLYVILRYVTGVFSGDPGYDFYVNHHALPLYIEKPAMASISLQPLISSIENMSTASYQVILDNLFSSPVNILQIMLWISISPLSAYALKKKEFGYETWKRSLLYIFGVNALLYAASAYSRLNGDLSLLLNISAHSGYFVSVAMLGSIFSSGLYPALLFYYRDISKAFARKETAYTGRVSVKTAKPIAEETRPTISWDEIGGLESVKQELRDAIELPAKQSDLYQKYKIKPSKGVLLFGPPGCGKTLLAKAVSSQINASFREVKGSDVLSKYFGESEKLVEALFKDLKANPPSILCVDEAESLFTSRDTSLEAQRGVVSSFLRELDGVDPTTGVYVVAITNKPDQMDEALLRPGRFDKLIYVAPPDLEAREQLFRISLSNRPLSEDIDYRELAGLTERWSGADIELLCNDAAALVAKEAHRERLPDRPITIKDLTDLISRRSPSISLSSLRRYEEFKIKYERRVQGTEASSVLLDASYSWDDIGGYEAVKEELREAIEYPISNPELYKKYNVRRPKGVIFHGPPGTGKTLFAKVLASTSKARFFSVRGPEILNKWVGASEARLREIFDLAREKAPSIIFFDEIDAVAPRRFADDSSNVSARIVSQMLTEMDGVEADSSIIVIATTNRLDLLDEALLRPGRFDKIIEIPLPDRDARESILRVHLKGRPVSDDIGYEALSWASEGMSGADIAAACNEASMMLLRDSLRKGSDVISVLEQGHMMEAITFVKSRAGVDKDEVPTSRRRDRSTI